MLYASQSGTTTAAVILDVVLFVGGIFLYILPSLIASRRRSANLSPVVVVNIFLGWTVVGWVVALAMAVSGPSGRPPKQMAQYAWQPPRSRT